MLVMQMDFFGAPDDDIDRQTLIAPLEKAIDFFHCLVRQITNLPVQAQLLESRPAKLLDQTVTFGFDRRSGSRPYCPLLGRDSAASTACASDLK